MGFVIFLFFLGFFFNQLAYLFLNETTVLLIGLGFWTISS